MKIAFVTPSYRGDLDRCRLLCESTTRMLPAGVEHLLIIDRRDLPLFKPLENGVVRVVEGDALLPWWMFRLPGLPNWRFNWLSVPVRGWIYQQLLKISAARATDADVIHFVDSDVVLTRPFDTGYLVKDGLVRLQHTAYESPSHRRWLEVARKLLGLDPEIPLEGNFVGNFITWRRENVLKMIAHLEEKHHSSWIRRIASELQFSEYMLYGVYATKVLGLEAAGHFVDSSPNLSLCWDYDVRTEEGMDRFFDDLPEDSMGLMIHSKYGIPVEKYRPRIEALWSRWA
jgi:hypothetical protein